MGNTQLIISIAPFSLGVPSPLYGHLGKTRASAKETPYYSPFFSFTSSTCIYISEKHHELR